MLANSKTINLLDDNNICHTELIKIFAHHLRIYVGRINPNDDG